MGNRLSENARLLFGLPLYTSITKEVQICMPSQERRAKAGPSWMPSFEEKDRRWLSFL